MLVSYTAALIRVRPDVSRYPRRVLAMVLLALAAEPAGAQVLDVRPVTPVAVAPTLRELRAQQEEFESFRRQRLPHWGGSLAPDRCDAACERVSNAIERTLADERGRWILGMNGDLRDAASELALSGVVEGRILEGVIDRTFVDSGGRRWIVDFKTSTHEGGGLEAFLDEEVVRYHPQLQRYARLMRLLHPDQPVAPPTGPVGGPEGVEEAEQLRRVGTGGPDGRERGDDAVPVVRQQGDHQLRRRPLGAVGPLHRGGDHRRRLSTAAEEREGQEEGAAHW